MTSILSSDFNFYISLKIEIEKGGNKHDIMLFNEVISNLGI
jgi:hypothetical protein